MTRYDVEAAGLDRFHALSRNAAHHRLLVDAGDGAVRVYGFVDAACASVFIWTAEVVPKLVWREAWSGIS